MFWFVGTRVKEEALPRLLSLLSPVVHSWRLFALQIGVPMVQIAQIQATNPPTNPTSLYMSLAQALEWWIANHHNSTYEVIISVLDPKLDETTPVMNRALAGQVRGFMAKEQGELYLKLCRPVTQGIERYLCCGLRAIAKRSLVEYLIMLLLPTCSSSIPPLNWRGISHDIQRLLFNVVWAVTVVDRWLSNLHNQQCESWYTVSSN